MDPLTLLLTGGGISGLLGVGSSALSFGLNKASAKKQYNYQKALLRQQQAWAEKMANTAHQREVTDLRKAGLNPILSATGGNGAATPVVSAPSAPAGQSFSSDLGGDFMDGVNSGISAAKMDSAINNVNSQTDLNAEKIKSEKSQQNLNDSLASEAAARTKEIQSGLPVNRIAGHAINSGKGVIKEGFGLVKDVYDLIQTKSREKSMKSSKRERPVKRARGVVWPAYEYMNK